MFKYFPESDVELRSDIFIRNKARDAERNLVEIDIILFQNFC